MKFNYDQEEDVLYLSFAVADEDCDYFHTAEGNILRIGTESGKIFGCTILRFKRKLLSGEINVPEIGAFPAPEDLLRLVGVS